MSHYVDVSNDVTEITTVSPGQRRIYLSGSFGTSAMDFGMSYPGSREEFIDFWLSNPEMKERLLLEHGNLETGKKVLDSLLQENDDGTLNLCMQVASATAFGLVYLDFDDNGIRKAKLKPVTGVDDENYIININAAEHFVIEESFAFRASQGPLNIDNILDADISPEVNDSVATPEQLEAMKMLTASVMIPFTRYAGETVDTQTPRGTYDKPLSTEELRLRDRVREMIQAGALHITQSSSPETKLNALWKIQRNVTPS